MLRGYERRSGGCTLGHRRTQCRPPPAKSKRALPPSRAHAASRLSATSLASTACEHSSRAFGLHRINRNVDCRTELPPRPSVNRGCYHQPLPQPDATKPCTMSLKRRSGCTSFHSRNYRESSLGRSPPLHTCVRLGIPVTSSLCPASLVSIDGKAKSFPRTGLVI